MPERLLFVFAKEPRPGHVKTRLCPPLSAGQAARCQRAFLSDLLERLHGAAASRTVLWAAPRDDAPELVRTAAERGLELAWQGEGDLGRRMERALRAAAGEPAVIVGADSPDLPRAYVEEAFASLDDGMRGDRLVLGPSRDGGYYLVGCRGSVPPIFELDVAWGSASVFERTLARAAAAGVAPHRLPPWWDVDDAAGLSALAGRLRAAPAEAPACARLIAELEREGLGL